MLGDGADEAATLAVAPALEVVAPLGGSGSTDPVPPLVPAQAARAITRTGTRALGRHLG
jgi:hypothetical protein